MVRKNENPENRTVIFLHIPKTAGTTLIRVMEQQYRPEDVYSIVEPQDFQELADLSETRKAEFRLLVGHMDFGAHELLPGPSTYLTLLRHPVERVISHYYFPVVGLAERFDETLLLLKRAFGWQHPFYRKRNVTTNRPKQGELLATTRDTIIHANQLDMELYRYATALFKEQVRRQGPLFPVTVRSFQLASKLLSAYWEIRKHSIRTFARKWIGSS